MSSNKKSRFYSQLSDPAKPTIKEEKMKEENTQAPVETTETKPVVEEKAAQVENTQAPVPNKVQSKGVKVAQKPAVDVVEHTREEVVEKTTPVTLVEQKKEAAATTDADVVIENARNSTNQLIKGVAVFLDKYNSSMAPGYSIDPKAGGSLQLNLYTSVNQILAQADYTEFRAAFNVLLAYMSKYAEGIFSERYLFRFAEEWPAGPDKLVHFQAMMNLLKIINNPKERPVKTYVSLDRTFNTGFTETGKENIMRFIGQ